MAIWYCASDKWTAVTAWATATAYNIGDIRRQNAAPAVGSERVFRCTTAGTSGGAEPTWVLTKGATTADGVGSLVWTEITGSSTYNATNTFAAPHARLASLVAWMAAGDTGYVGNHHAETQATSITVAMPGTLASPNLIICVDDTNVTPSETTGAVANATAGSAFTLSGHGTVVGLEVNIGSGSSNNVNMNIATGNTKIRLKNCRLIILSTGNSCRFAVGPTGTVAPAHVLFDNVSIRGNAAGQGFDLCNVILDWNGGAFITGGTGISTSLFRVAEASTGKTGCIVKANGLDMVLAPTAIVLIGACLGSTEFHLSNWKMPSGWTGTLFATTPGVGVKATMYNCDAGDTNYRYWYHDYTGEIKSDIGNVMTSGMSDGVTSIGLRINSSANCKWPTHVLRSPTFAIRNSAITASKTATVHFIHDTAVAPGQGTGTSSAFTDAEVYLEGEYLGTTNFPLSLFVSDSPANLLATPADQATSSATWTTANITTPVKQQTSITFTPQEIGYVSGTICCGIASKTFYVNIPNALT